MDDLHWVQFATGLLLAEAWPSAERMLAVSAEELETMKRTMAAMPPLVNEWAPERSGDGVRVPLVSIDGPTGAYLEFLPGEGRRWQLVGLAGRVPAPVTEMPESRPDGRMEHRNPTGDFADRFVAFAASIGAAEKSEQVNATNALFAGVNLRDRLARQTRLKEFAAEDSEAVKACTGRYCASRENVSDLLAEFIERNPESFLY